MHDQAPHARRICGAKTRDGGSCRNMAVLGNGRCRMHGGKSLSGTASPSFVHGRYSKDLGGAANVLERYQTHRSDVDATQLLDEIALLRARAGELLANLEHRESGGMWRAVETAFGALTEAMKKRERDRIGQQLGELRDLIEKGAQPYQTWGEIGAHLELISRLVRVEQTRETRLQETLTGKQAELMLAVVQFNLRAAVMRNCDESTTRRILADFSEGVRRDFARQNAALPGGGS